MYIRIVTIKCPNERAKKALKLLNKEVTDEQMRIGLIKETTIDTSESTVVYVKYWISKKYIKTSYFDEHVMIRSSPFVPQGFLMLYKILKVPASKNQLNNKKQHF